MQGYKDKKIFITLYLNSHCHGVSPCTNISTLPRIIRNNKTYHVILLFCAVISLILHFVKILLRTFLLMSTKWKIGPVLKIYFMLADNCSWPRRFTADFWGRSNSWTSLATYVSVLTSQYSHSILGKYGTNQVLSIDLKFYSMRWNPYLILVM